MEVMRGIFVLRLKLDVSGENVMQMMEMDIGQREREGERRKHWLEISRYVMHVGSPTA